MLITLVVVLAISLTLFAVWAHRAVREQRQVEMQQKQMQAIRLAEAGVDRAIALRAIDSHFERETWDVPAATLHGNQAGEVSILIVPGAKAGKLRVESEAHYPAGDIHSVQYTRILEIPDEPSVDPS